MMVYKQLDILLDADRYFRGSWPLRSLIAVFFGGSRTQKTRVLGNIYGISPVMCGLSQVIYGLP